MDDFFQQLRDAVMARLRNPLLVCFLLAWPVYNYKVFLVIWGGGEFGLKIDYIDKYLSLDNQWRQIIIWPAITAATYTFAWPFFDRWIKIYQLWQENRTIRAELELKKKVPLSPQEQAEWFDQFEAERKKQEQAVAAMSQQLQREKAEFVKERNELKDRLQKQALARLADSSPYGSDAVLAVLHGKEASNVTVPEGRKLVIHDLKLEHIRPLSRFVLATAKEPRSASGEVVVTSQRVSQLMGTAKSDWIDVLEAVGLGTFDQWGQFNVVIEGGDAMRTAVCEAHEQLDSVDYERTVKTVNDEALKRAAGQA